MVEDLWRCLPNPFLSSNYWLLCSKITVYDNSNHFQRGECGRLPQGYVWTECKLFNTNMHILLMFYRNDLFWVILTDLSVILFSLVLIDISYLISFSLSLNKTTNKCTMGTRVVMVKMSFQHLTFINYTVVRICLDQVK